MRLIEYIETKLNEAVSSRENSRTLDQDMDIERFAEVLDTKGVVRFSKAATMAGRAIKLLLKAEEIGKPMYFADNHDGVIDIAFPDDYLVYLVFFSSDNQHVERISVYGTELDDYEGSSLEVIRKAYSRKEIGEEIDLINSVV